MKAHDEPRTDLDSHEAVCLQARSVRPLSITHDAVIHGAMSDATLSARRAGRSPMASPACARVRSASNSIKIGLGMGYSGARATPQARAGCGGSIVAAHLTREKCTQRHRLIVNNDPKRLRAPRRPLNPSTRFRTTLEADPDVPLSGSTFDRVQLACRRTCLRC